MSPLVALLVYLAAALLIVGGYFAVPALLFYAGLRSVLTSERKNE